MRQGQRGFLYASFTLQTPQLGSFPGLPEQLHEWPLGVVHMNDDRISESLYCCTEQSKAYSIQEKVMLVHKAILSLSQVHEGVFPNHQKGDL